MQWFRKDNHAKVDKMATDIDVLEGRVQELHKKYNSC